MHILLFRYTLPHLMLIPVATLVLLTLLTREKEDYRWFIFNTAILNLLLGFFRESTYFFKIQNVYTYIDYTINVAVNSIFPLAFTRFLFLYYEKSYSRLFKKRYLIFWILGYDLAIFGVDYFKYTYNISDYLKLFIGFFLLICTIVFSCLILYKLRQMRKLFDKGENFKSYKDLNRTVFIFIFQACIISLHLLNAIFCVLFTMYISIDPFWFEALFPVYMFCNPLQYPLYYFFVIVDSCMTMVVLRSYRKIFINMLKFFARMMKRMLNRSYVEPIV